MNLVKDQIMSNPNCSINNPGTELFKRGTKLYKCICSENLIICSECKYSCCHQKHQSEEIPLNRFPLENFTCGCAMANHKPITNNKTHNQEYIYFHGKCDMLKYFEIFKYDFIYEKITNPEEKFCLFCAYYCNDLNSNNEVEDELIDNNEETNNFNKNKPKVEILNEETIYYEKLKENKINKVTIKEKFIKDFTKIELTESNKFCSCIKLINHYPREREKFNLYKLIKKDIYRNAGLNPNNFCIKIFLNENIELYKNITEKFISYNKNISHALKGNKKFNILQFRNKNTLNIEYIYISKVIEAVSTHFKRSKIFLDKNTGLPTEFLDCINIDFLQSLLSIERVENDFLVAIIKQNLRLFRKFILSQKINSKNIYIDQIDENISPVHRKIIMRSLSIDFYNDIEIEKDRFDCFMDDFEKNITDSIKNFHSQKFSNALFKLYGEYLHILNLLGKYRFDNLEFVEIQISKIHEFIKFLFTNNKKNKIYLIKKQILKFIIRVLIKINDEKFNNFIDFDNKKKKKNKNYEKIQFSFIKNKLNENLLNIFLMINHKTLSLEPKDNILTSQMNYFMEIIMIKNDSYYTNLLSMCKNKNFILNFDENKMKINLIKDEDSLINFNKVINLVQEIYDFIPFYNSLLVQENIFLEKISKNISEINKIFSLELDKKKQKLSHMNLFQNLLYKNNYLSILFQILNLLRKINLCIPIKKLIELYSIIYENLTFFCKENPFLAVLIFTRKFTKTLCFRRESYNIKLLEFYQNIFKVLKKYSYTINTLSVFNNFRMNFSYNYLSDLEKSGKYDELNFVSIFLSNLIIVSNEFSKPIISQIISQSLKNVFSENFYTRLFVIINKIAENSEINQNEKDIFFTYENCIKIIISLPNGHFIATNSNLDKRFTKELIIKILSIEHLPPNVRSSYISFFSKYNLFLFYQTTPAKDFDMVNYRYMFEKKIPYIFQENSLLNQNNEEINRIPELEIIIQQLNFFPKLVEEYNEYFQNHKTDFFKYFAFAFFLPCVNSILNIIYFNNFIKSDLKYILYKIVILFLKGFLLFLNKVEEYSYYDPLLFYKYLSIEEGLNIIHLSEEDNISYLNLAIFVLRKISIEIKNDLRRDIIVLDSEFYLLKDKNISNVFFNYINYFIFKDKVLDDDKLTNHSIINLINKEKKNLNEYISKDNIFLKEKNINLFTYVDKLCDFLKEYNKFKQEKKNLIYNYIFLDDRKYKEINPQWNTFDLNLRNEMKKSFFLNLFDNFYDYSKTNHLLFYQFDESNFIYLKKLLKIFLLDPKFCQDILIEKKNQKHSIEIIQEMIKKNLIFLFQLVFIDFNEIRPVPLTRNYKNLMKILDYLRLLCEDHNRIFQTYLVQKFQLNETNQNFSLVEYIFSNFEFIEKFIAYKIEKKPFLAKFYERELNYFDILSKKITDFLVEIIQGNFSYNIETCIIGSINFNDYSYKFLNKIDEIHNNKIEYEKIMNNYFTVFLSLLEEENNLSDIFLEKITKNLNVKNIMSIVVHCIKKLIRFFSLNKNNPENLINYFNEKIFLEENSADFLLDAYKLKKEFQNHYLLKLLINCFLIIKILSSLNTKIGLKAKDLLYLYKDAYFNISDYKNSEESTTKKIYLHRFEVYKFLYSLIKNVEITITKIDPKPTIGFFESNKHFEFILSDNKDKFNENPQIKKNSFIDNKTALKTINFLVYPDSLYLIDFDFAEFKKNIPIDNYEERISKIVKMKENILLSLSYIKKIKDHNSKIILFLSSIDYKILEFISILIVLANNIIMIGTWDYYDLEGLDKNYSRVENLSLANIVFLSLVIMNYLYFACVREYNGFFPFINNLWNSDILALFWNLFFGIMGILNSKSNFLYSLQLFSVISLSDTMKSIIYSIHLRSRQFLSTFVVIIIMIIFYTGISFYYLRDYYVIKDDDSKTYLCSNFIFCFFIIFSNGIRMGGGIGDLIGLQNFNDQYFWGVFIFQWLFYFMIVLIMLNSINGIIVDTFQSLREKSEHDYYISKNTCFICGINKIKFQLKNLDLKSHENYEHNFNNYIYYIIKIHKENEHELNSIDYETLILFREEKTNFFPNKTCTSLMSRK